jgi:hypothetical protein
MWVTTEQENLQHDLCFALDTLLTPNIQRNNQLLLFLAPRQNIELFMILCDNVNLVRLIRNLIFHSKTKHVTMYYNFVRKKFESEKISIAFIPSREQIVNILTKPLEKALFEKFIDEIQRFCI